MLRPSGHWRSGTGAQVASRSKRLLSRRLPGPGRRPADDHLRHYADAGAGRAGLFAGGSPNVETVRENLTAILPRALALAGRGALGHRQRLSGPSRCRMDGADLQGSGLSVGVVTAESRRGCREAYARDITTARPANSVSIRDRLACALWPTARWRFLQQPAAANPMRPEEGLPRQPTGATLRQGRCNGLYLCWSTRPTVCLSTRPARPHSQRRSPRDCGRDGHGCREPGRRTISRGRILEFDDKRLACRFRLPVARSCEDWPSHTIWMD